MEMFIRNAIPRRIPLQTLFVKLTTKNMGKLRKSGAGCSPSDQMTYKRMLTQDFLSLITNIYTSGKSRHPTQETYSKIWFSKVIPLRMRMRMSRLGGG